MKIGTRYSSLAQLVNKIKASLGKYGGLSQNKTVIKFNSINSVLLNILVKHGFITYMTKIGDNVIISVRYFHHRYGYNGSSINGIAAVRRSQAKLSARSNVWQTRRKGPYACNVTNSELGISTTADIASR